MKKVLIRLLIVGLLVICTLPVAGATNSDTGVSVCGEEDMLPNCTL